MTFITPKGHSGVGSNVEIFDSGGFAVASRLDGSAREDTGADLVVPDVGDRTTFRVNRLWLAQAAPKKDGTLRLASVPFEIKGVPSYYALVIPELISFKLFQRIHIKLAGRARVDGVLKDWKFRLGDAVGEGKIAELGQLAGANALLTGTCVKEGDNLLITARVVDGGGGKALAAAELAVPQSLAGEAPFRLGEMLAGKLKREGVSEPVPSGRKEIVPQVKDAFEPFGEGIEKYFNGDYKGAIEAYTKAIELDPKFAMAYINRGRAKDQLGDYKGEIEDSTRAIELDPKLAMAYINRGAAKGLLGDYVGAIEDCTKTIELDPKLDAAYIIRGVAKGQISDYRGAIGDYTKAIELDPKYALAYYNRGRVKGLFGDYKGEIEDYTKASELDPNDAKVYKDNGWAKGRLGDHKGAIEDYTKAIELDPNNAMAYANRGVAKSKLGDHRGAIEDSTKAIELNPKLAAAYVIRGVSKVQLDDHRGAIGDSTKAIELDPRSAAAYVIRGAAKFRLGDNRGAIGDSARAIELNPRSAAAYSNRGLAKGNLGDVRGAIEDCTKAMAIEPDSPYIQDGLGCAYYKAGQYKAALEMFEKAMKTFEAKGISRYEIYYHLGVVLLQVGKVDEAISLFEMSLRINADAAEVTTAIRAARDIKAGKDIQFKPDFLPIRDYRAMAEMIYDDLGSGLLKGLTGTEFEEAFGNSGLKQGGDKK